MERLTTDNPNGNLETMLNFVYGKDGWAHIRHDGKHGDVSLTDWVKRQCLIHGCDEVMKGTPEEIDQRLCDCMMDSQIVCPIAMAYCFAIQAVHLRTRLKMYEDTGLGPDEITTEPYGCAFYCNRKCNIDGDFCAEGPGCPHEINAETAKHLLELAQAEKDGRLVVLPCKESTVYTIEEDYFNCAGCRHRDSAYYQEDIKRVSCDMDSGVRCPFYIKENEVTGFEIMFDKTGNVVLSGPGEFGYEGLEQFTGIDSKVYYTREEAEAALKKMEEADNAAD